MTLDQVMKLLDAGYSKDEIQALNQGTVSVATDPAEEARPEKPAEKPEAKPETKEEEKPLIDYARLSRELMKAAASVDSGRGDIKTKEEMLEDSLLSFCR